MKRIKMNELQENLKEVQKQSLGIYNGGWVEGKWVDDETAQKFYACHSQALAIKEQISALKNQLKVVSVDTKTQAAIDLEERRAIKEACVTSSTFERAQKRLFKQVDGFLSGRY
ncbi:MAG: hypothetical protein ACJAS1_003689 [Oleiphilaceae bacterium]|jgi:hypothetical protein